MRAAARDRQVVQITEVKDLTALRDFHSVEDVALAHDHVALPADPIEEFLPLLDGDMPSGEHVTLYTGYDGTTPIAAMSVTLFTLDNLTSANVEGYVHPAHRRRGLGRELLEHAVDVVQSAGRTRVFFEAPWLPSGEEGPAFPMLRAAGAKPVLDDYRRLLDLQAFPVGSPAEVPSGYRLIQWVDRAPEELLDGLAYLLHRMVLDAPMGDMDYEPEKWDAARYRASEDSAIRRKRTRYTTVVVHEATGAVAGLTEVCVNLGRPELAHQWNTIVDPSHRGRRLGLVLKSWNHQAVASAVPDLRWVVTWNATSNSYMIDVNEALGFLIAEKWTEWQLDL
ncbi:MAG TPA: GNAT family N-acetyltransferase [Mycobacteriales bacterium]|nr:GNAT family N-acetyltransferase [Mycobacteriales bacterium]